MYSENAVEYPYHIKWKHDSKHCDVILASMKKLLSTLEKYKHFSEILNINKCPNIKYWNIKY